MPYCGNETSGYKASQKKLKLAVFRVTVWSKAECTTKGMISYWRLLT